MVDSQTDFTFCSDNFNGKNIVDTIYDINEEYKNELNKPEPDADKLIKCLNKQLLVGLFLQND